ncbi:MAG: DUF3137 domain-containing protein [Candidatus Chaera renei]|uniref:DUF3137 domain-containing protein n=1 Tax=Candidatus Chaera renei TaxID=2506947 RepID=A0A4Q0AKI5_9BACT|nr:MAG: DUF3137 domain-containing protein [Candidatus Chaera renei]
MLYGWLGAIAGQLANFAQAGGGGSSSDSGGSGVFLLGYVPMHAVGYAIRRKTRNNIALWYSGQLLGWALAAVYTVFWIILGVSSRRSSNRFLLWSAAALVPLGMGVGLYASLFNQSKKTKKTLQWAASQDGAWKETGLLERAREVFERYQQDWSNYNTEAMKSYMTSGYQYHASLMVYAMYLAARRNLVKNPVIEEISVVDATDAADNVKDQFKVAIGARAENTLIDTRDNSVLFVDKSRFVEFWTFQRSGNQWMLGGVEPATQAQEMRDKAVEQFAISQNFYYSLDWGRLLLPRRSQLFKSGKFRYSDVNNHVIGMYKNCLVQFYTYIPDRRSRYDSDGYVIAQAALPKTYGNIFVRRKKKWWLRSFGFVKGLRKITLEWREFNDKYDVYASDAEKVTSLELLHPAFMEKLEALPFTVNIEVADNTVYLFAEAGATSKVKPTPYPVMMDILKEAFSEMKL